MERVQWRVQPVGQAPRIAHHRSDARVLVDADQHALARRPGTLDGVGAHVVDHLLVDALGGAAQRQLAQAR